MKKTKFKNRTCGTNAIDGATTTARSWGFYPVPGKGGATCNAAIFDKKGGGKNAEK